MSARAQLASSFAWLLLGGCASQSFQPTFQTPAHRDLEHIARELATLPPRTEAQVVVAVTTEPTRLLAWRLDALAAGPLWEHAVDAKSAPLIAGDAVVMQEGKSIVVRDLKTGAVRVKLHEDARLVGADGEGDAVVIAMLHEGESDERGTVAFVRGSSLRWSESLSLSVGVPALARGYVIVPWATQRLSVLDAKDGAELSRWYFNGAVLGHARVEGDGLYVGQLGLLRVRPEMLATNAVDANWVAPVLRPLPGPPPLMLDGNNPVPEPENAYHHVRLDFRVGAQDALLDDAVYARFYRLLFGLRASADEVRFVHILPRDIVGVAVVSGGVLVGDEAGTLRFVSRDGQARVIAELGRALSVASLRATTWTPPPPAPPAATEPAPPPPPALPAQLYAAATLDDARLSAGRVYALQQLARTPSAEVTAQLVELCIATSASEAVRRAACERVEARDAGGEAVLLALRNGQAGSDRTGALAKAAVHMQLKPAGALLAPQVLDLRTDPRELPVVITALAELGHTPAAASIDRFLRLHHAEPESSELMPALQASTGALGALRAKAHRDTLAFVAADGMTAEPLRLSSQAALAQLDNPPKPARAAETAAAPAAAAPVAAAAPAPDPRPRYLSAELVDDTLRPVHAQLVGCLKDAPEAPKSLRIAMVVGAAGEVESAYMLPGTLQACAEELVLPRRFPVTQQGRQNVTHVVHLPAADKPEAPRKPKAAKAASPTAPPPATARAAR